MDYGQAREHRCATKIGDTAFRVERLPLKSGGPDPSMCCTGRATTGHRTGLKQSKEKQGCRLDVWGMQDWEGPVGGREMPPSAFIKNGEPDALPRIDEQRYFLTVTAKNE